MSKKIENIQKFNQKHPNLDIRSRIFNYLPLIDRRKLDLRMLDNNILTMPKYTSSENHMLCKYQLLLIKYDPNLIIKLPPKTYIADRVILAAIYDCRFRFENIPQEYRCTELYAKKLRIGVSYKISLSDIPKQFRTWEICRLIAYSDNVDVYSIPVKETDQSLTLYLNNMCNVQDMISSASILKTSIRQNVNIRENVPSIGVYPISRSNSTLNITEKMLLDDPSLISIVDSTILTPTLCKKIFNKMPDAYEYFPDSCKRSEYMKKYILNHNPHLIEFMPNDMLTNTESEINTILDTLKTFDVDLDKHPVLHDFVQNIIYDEVTPIHILKRIFIEYPILFYTKYELQRRFIESAANLYSILLDNPDLIDYIDPIILDKYLYSDVGDMPIIHRIFSTLTRGII